MPRALKAFIVLVLVALVPLRAVAGVTVGFCASGHQDMAVTGHAAPGAQYTCPMHPVFGILLSPIFAGAAMAASSVSVVTNAPGLRRVGL